VRILVTGSEGFIGSWLVPELERAGHDVWGVDKVNNSYADYTTDLTHPHEFAEVVDMCKPEAVVHLAAQVGREFGEDDVIHTVVSNAQMTTQIARECGERDIKLLYVSSSEVYGDNKLTDVDEQTGPFHLPHNLYGLTKRWGEEACQLYLEPWNLKIARLSMPYGPGAPPGRGRRAMDNFLWWAHHGQEITVHQGAERSWCWVGDTVRGLRLILESDNYGLGPDAYNVGRDDKPMTMAALAMKACDIAGADWQKLVKEVPAPKNQTVVKRLNTDRLRALGWEPTVELDEGMEEVYEWVKQFDSEGNRR
jgi:nucleoside-diphosphate-sugar epimerase